MDLTKASIHDVNYLSEVKKSVLNACTLIADKGYLSSTYQLDLFTVCKIDFKLLKDQIRKDNHIRQYSNELENGLKHYLPNYVTNSCTDEIMQKQ
jgi:hypothetical protein